MRIIFTFDYDDCSIRACDLACFFIHYGHEVSFFDLKEKTKQIIHSYYGLKKIKIETNINNIKDYDLWIYEVTSWGNNSSAFNDLMESYKGLLVNINLEDGPEFCIDRVSNYVVDKTRLFINHSLYVDRDYYGKNSSLYGPKKINGRLFLSTSFITNSQRFRYNYVPHENKIKRVIFTGSMTGGTSVLTNNSDKEYRLRADLVERIYKHKEIDSILWFHNLDPGLKKLYDSIPDELKRSNVMLNEGSFIKTFSESLISLSVKGNSFPTNRFFESQAAGCITLSNKIKEVIDIFGIGEENVNYVTINVDGSDLIDIIKFYLDDKNKDRCKLICESARKTWEKYNMLDENGVYPEFTRLYHKTNLENTLEIKI